MNSQISFRSLINRRMDMYSRMDIPTFPNYRETLLSNDFSNYKYTYLFIIKPFKISRTFYSSSLRAIILSLEPY